MKQTKNPILFMGIALLILGIYLLVETFLNTFNIINLRGTILFDPILPAILIVLVLISIFYIIVDYFKPEIGRDENDS